MMQDMTEKMKSFNDQKGVSIIAAIFIIVILGFMGVMFVALIGTGSLTSVNDMQSTQALYAAEGGAEYAVLAFNTGIACNALTYALPLGVGNFTTAGTLFNPASTTLQVAIPDAVSTNPVSVVSTAGFAPHGRITIGTEYIHYDAIAGNTFTGIRRGAGGSIAAAHAATTAVSQNECLIRSVGTVGSAQRIVERGVAGGGGAGIAFDAASSTISNAAIFNWNHTVSGNYRILLVGISINNTAANVTAVTFNGAPLTYVGARNNSVRVEIWRLVNPDAGNYPVQVTLPVAARVVAGAVSFTGVDQTTPLDVAAAFNTANSATPSVTIAPVTNNAWVVDTLASNQIASNANPTGAGQIWRWGNINGVAGAASTIGPISPAGATTMSWTVSGGSPKRSAIGAVALRPAAVGGVVSIDWRDSVR